MSRNSMQQGRSQTCSVSTEGQVQVPQRDGQVKGVGTARKGREGGKEALLTSPIYTEL